MNILNQISYDPHDDNSPTGYRRPPREAYAVNDYFAAIGETEDDGEFAAQEMTLLLNNPEKFFGTSK